MIWRPFFPLEARVFLFSAEGMRGWTSVWALVWRVRRPWRGAEAGAPVTRAEHAVACASVSMDSTLLWGHRVASPCVKGRMQPERISCAQRFHTPCGHRMGRRKCCPHQLSLFSFCMRKEGEGREIPCSCLVCWRNWKWVRLVLESNIAWTLCSEELWRDEVKGLNLLRFLFKQQIWDTSVWRNCVNWGFSLTSWQLFPPLISFLANVVAVKLGQGGPGGGCPQSPREERECAGTSGRVPGQAVTQLLGSVSKRSQGRSKFTEKGYYLLLSPVLSCLKCWSCYNSSNAWKRWCCSNKMLQY